MDGSFDIVHVTGLGERWPVFVASLVAPDLALEEATRKKDIQAIWDCKQNSLNATLWAPKFCVPTTLDTKDLVVK